MKKKVHLIAPSSGFSMKACEEGIKRLESAGYEIVSRSPLRASEPAYLNGSDAVRLEELQKALSQKDDIVWLIRGGYGLTRILPQLRCSSATLPIIIGFSDASALLAQLWRQHGLKSIHGPGVISLSAEPEASFAVLQKIIAGRAKEIVYPRLHVNLVPPHAPSEFMGPLVAMNLCVLTHLIGTSSMPNLEGCILLIEEVGERPYRIDRMLTQLYHSKALNGVKAVIVGHLTRCQEHDSDKPMDVCVERLSSFGLPVFSGMPVGHESPNFAVPFGALVRLTIEEDEAQLQVCEEIYG